MDKDTGQKYIDSCMTEIGDYLHTPLKEWAFPEQAREATLEWYYKLHDVLNGKDEI